MAGLKDCLYVELCVCERRRRFVKEEVESVNVFVVSQEENVSHARTLRVNVCEFWSRCRQYSYSIYSEPVLWYDHPAYNALSTLKYL